MPRLARARTLHGEFAFLENDEHIAPRLLAGEHYEADDIAAALPYAREGSVVIDAGAHVGLWAIPLARRVSPSGRVLAFEPQRLLHTLLVENARANGLENLAAVRAALGHLDGAKVRLQAMVPSGASAGRDVDYDHAGPMAYGAITLGVGGEAVRMCSIDGLRLSDVSLVKLDVEGAERLVLFGARETLRASRPVIVFEDIADEPKPVTRSMREVMAIDEEVARFDFVRFCLEELSYARCERLSELNRILFP